MVLLRKCGTYGLKESFNKNLSEMLKLLTCINTGEKDRIALLKEIYAQYERIINRDCKRAMEDQLEKDGCSDDLSSKRKSGGRFRS